jgi:cytochrome c553
MKPNCWILVLALLASPIVLVSAKLTPEQIHSLPAPVDRKVSFDKEIRPLLENSCVKCHGNGKRKGEFNIDTRENLLKGGESGPAVISGQSAESYLIELVSGLDPDNIMPQKGSKLKPEQVALLRAWIDQGVGWEEGFTFKKAPVAPLEPRRPNPPAARKNSGLTEPVDLFIDAYFKKHGMAWPKPVDDRIFARRAYLDVIGLLPTPEELQQFLQDRQPDKRRRLVQQLLADNRRYAEHWLTFWNDMLRNDYRGTGYIDGGRKQISRWLFTALATNKPFDQFVAELINPNEDSLGFSKGIVWRGAVNASQVPEMQAAQNISQIFMGVNLKCASCHDSFINDWELADAYGLASIYAEGPMEMFKCDAPTGKQATMKFIYPELGSIDPALPKRERLKQLAEIITSPKNGRLTRTMVNRLWARFMGRGLVEPLDEMDSPAWNPELLDWLAADFAENGYDLRKTMERILTSRSYQLPAIGMSELKAKEYVFQGPVVRRMTAEQFYDALALLTQRWGQMPATSEIDFSVVANPASLNTSWPKEPRWIWISPQAHQSAPAETVYFRKTFQLAEIPAEASVLASCDNSFTVYINGKEAGGSKEWEKPRLLDIRKHLITGENLIAIAGTNASVDDKAAANPNPAGLLVYVRLRNQKTDNGIPIERMTDFVSDSTWLCTTNKFEDWQKPSFEPEGWIATSDLGGLELGPWHIEPKLKSAMALVSVQGKVRASLLNNDPLMTALGRPNREQVITSRASAATTLQALELTNGATLAKLLDEGADHLFKELPNTEREVIETLYERALFRKPTPEEFRTAQALLGSPVQKEGVADLLWAMTMLPEFQLIY